MIQTIVWDVDDVLNNLMQAWFEQAWKPAHADSRLGYQDIRDNPPYRSLGIGKAEYLASLDDFRVSPEARLMPPNAAVMAWLREHGSAYRHVALTARPMSGTPAAAEWLFRNFGDYFRCVGVVPARGLESAPVYDRDKGDFLRWLGHADYFIDDSEENIAAARKLGIRCILFPHPWNSAAGSAEEALKTIDELTIAHRLAI